MWPPEPEPEPGETYLSIHSDDFREARRRGLEPSVTLDGQDVTKKCVAAQAGEWGWVWCYTEDLERREYCPCGCLNHAHGTVRQGFVRITLRERARA